FFDSFSHVCSPSFLLFSCLPYWEHIKMSTSGGGASGKVAGRRLFQLGAFPGSKSEGAASTLGLARLDYHKAKPGGTVKVGAESAIHFNFDGLGWVCYSPRKTENWRVRLLPIRRS
ncbi:hypothetical protein, partial [Intestinimonas butyriciproducens]|uniref:hypothetical protein n=1 Tax=Intestinimonas butyriciproducens TaxID=1297617 RepID=UPI0031B612B6